MTEKITLPSRLLEQSADDFTIEIPPGVSEDDAVCTVHAAWRMSPCGRAAKNTMTDGNYFVKVCGIHVRTLRARGWNKHE